MMIELDAFTGLRRGELIGLRWQDVNFESLILRVRRSVVAMWRERRKRRRHSKTYRSTRKRPSASGHGRAALLILLRAI